ncbi:MAG: hypothetical protein AABX48_03255 [Nanoarchaeota archaeon]
MKHELYQKYEQTLRTGIRKLKWYGFLGMDEKFEKTRKELDWELAGIMNNAYDIGVGLNTKYILGLESRLLKLKVDRDVRVLRGSFN